MNLRQAAALTLMGWYLMVPKIDLVTATLDTNDPLRSWTTEGSYETAAECERARQGRLQRDLTIEAKIASDLQDVHRAINAQTDKQMGLQAGTFASPPTLASDGWRASLCIASDDPGLSPK
jgi:hypothetical protein